VELIVQPDAHDVVGEMLIVPVKGDVKSPPTTLVLGEAPPGNGATVSTDPKST